MVGKKRKKGAARTKTIKTRTKPRTRAKAKTRIRVKSRLRKPQKSGTKKVLKAGRKVIFLVVDGLADRSKGGQTPLQLAKKPNIDWLASNGACGELGLITSAMWKSIDQRGVSQYANVNLLGYDASRYPLERGPLEAAGLGIPYKEGHLAIRCNFATVDKEMRILDRRAGRNTYMLDEIARYINENVRIGVNFLFMRTYGHRAVLIVKKKLSPNISSNDAGTGEIVRRIEPLSLGAEESAKLVQDFIDKSHNVIQFHQKNAERISRGIPPANYIIVRQPGNRIFALPNFARRWKIKNAVCISENGVMKATCMLAGFNSINVPEFDDHDKWLDFIFESIDSALAEYDFIYAHIKSADEAAHDKDPEKKRRIIEAIDARLEPFKKFNGILVLTCDHITSSESGMHERGSVPVLVYGKKKDDVKTFDEESVKKGLLKTMSGRELMKYIFGK